MSKYELFKLFLQNKRFRKAVYGEVYKNFQQTKLYKLFKLQYLFIRITFLYLTKRYLRETTLVDELEESFLAIKNRTQPLSKETVERFEKLAFTKIKPKPTLTETEGLDTYEYLKAQGIKYE